MIDHAQRDRLRKGWMRQAAMQPRTYIVGLLGEPVNWTDARLAVSAAMRAVLAGRDVRIVLHEEAAHFVKARRMAAELGLQNLIITDAIIAEPWRVLPGLDVVLLAGCTRQAVAPSRNLFSQLFIRNGYAQQPSRGAACVLPALWAMAARVPVLAEDSAVMRELLEDSPSCGWLIPPGDANAAADRIVRLADAFDGNAAASNAQADTLPDRLSIDAYRACLREAYDAAVQM